MANDTMEAEVQGIKLRGTPAQISEVIKLAGLVNEQIRAVPVIPEMDPWKRNLWPLTQTIDCSETFRYNPGIASAKN